MSENHREPELPEVSPSGRWSRWTCKDYLIGTCNNSFCDRWHPPKYLFYKTKSGCRFGEKCSFAHRQVDERPTKRSKTNNDKSAVAMLKNGNWQERESVSDGRPDRTEKTMKRGDEKLGQNSSKRQFSDARQLGCVFQDMKPPKSILRKGTDMPRPVQRVKFTKAIARHTKIRDQNPSAVRDRGTLKRCCGKRMGPKKCDSTEERLLRVERCSPQGAPRKPVW